MLSTARIYESNSKAMKVIAITKGMHQHEEQICRAIFDDPKWPEKMVHRRRLRH